ncbi:chymotrypsin-like elastase family member 3B [Hyperolius riggenbachi]|uniref:chymotrypsin-like elastase family member 3B n=1 Tax=Hyperolius riggenbachi TaxID=752182 RepID=UPI0035A39176
MLASRVMSQRPNSYLMPDSLIPTTNTMLRLVTSLLLLAAAYGCGVPTYLPNARVVNGIDAAPHSWPWQVSLQLVYPDFVVHNCGGSLITSRWVLTAAHCLSDKLKLKQLVVLGEHDRGVEEGSEQYFPFGKEDIFIHPLWDNNAVNGYDIALIKLPREAELNDKVKLGCLPPTDRRLYNNQPCIATGWGVIHSNGPQANILQQAVLPVVDHEHCSQPDWMGNIDPSLLCAGGFGQDVCQSDSGGPLNCQAGDGRWYIEGITSFGVRVCNTPKKPTIFTRVSLFNDWIDEIIANN